MFMDSLSSPKHSELRASLQFGLVTTARELLEVQHVRHHQYEARTPDVVTELLRDYELDRHGYVFLLRENGIPGATGRLAPITSCMTALHRIGKVPQEVEADPSVCEISRIAALRSGSGQPALLSMAILGLGARWALQHTSLVNYVAYCRLSLFRLYLAVGAQQIGEPFTLPNRGDRKFIVIGGRLADATAACEPALMRYDLLDLNTPEQPSQLVKVSS